METSERTPVDKAKAAALLAWGFLKHLWRRYNRDGCRESAAALTYVSLFALVPMMTLVFSIFSMIPAFQELGDQVNNIIFRNFIPESGTEIQSYLMDFSNQARKLSAVGVLILIVTSYLLLANIEKTFNDIWDTPGNRKGLTSFLLYWGVLSFGPLLVGLGLAMHTYLLSLELVVDDTSSLGVSALFLNYLPWLMTWVAFTMLFIAMPNCKVVPRYAIVGGLATTIVFQLVKSGFGSIVANTSFHSVYGAFAILPLFLFWIYLCWMIVLGGAELVRSLETFKTAYRGRRLPNLTAVVLVCWQCWDKQQKGQSINDRDMILAGVDQQHWLKLRETLIQYNYLEVTRHNHYILTRDISKITLWQLINLFGENFTRLPPRGSSRHLAEYPWASRLETLAKTAQEDCSNLFSVTLSELFKNFPKDVPQLDQPIDEEDADDAESCPSEQANGEGADTEVNSESGTGENGTVKQVQP
jgi:Predicted membrane protein